MHFLPQVSSEDLNQWDLESGDFTVHENTRQIKLYLQDNKELTLHLTLRWKDVYKNLSL